MSVRWEPREQFVALTPRQVEAHQQSLETAERMLLEIEIRLDGQVPSRPTRAKIEMLEKQIQHHEEMLREQAYIQERQGATGVEHIVPAHLWKVNETPEKQPEKAAPQPAAYMATYSVNRIGQLEMIFPDLVPAPKAGARGNMNQRLRAMNKAKAAKQSK